MPRHMRRRTTSHKPRRMPVALKDKDSTSRSNIMNNKNNRSRRSSSSGSRKKRPGAAPPPSGGGGPATNSEGVGGAELGARRCRKHRRRPRALLAMRSPHAVGEDREGRADGGDRPGNKKPPPRSATHRCCCLSLFSLSPTCHTSTPMGARLPVVRKQAPLDAAEEKQKVTIQG